MDTVKSTSKFKALILITVKSTSKNQGPGPYNCEIYQEKNNVLITNTVESTSKNQGPDP